MPSLTMKNAMCFCRLFFSQVSESIEVASTTDFSPLCASESISFSRFVFAAAFDPAPGEVVAIEVCVVVKLELVVMAAKDRAAWVADEMRCRAEVCGGEKCMGVKRIVGAL